MKCEKCGSVLVIDKGTYVCQQCGLVYQDVVFDEGEHSHLAPDRWSYGSFILDSSTLRWRQIQLSHTALFAAMNRARRLAAELQRVAHLTPAERDIVLEEFYRLVRKIPKESLPVSRAALLIALAYLLARERGKRVNLKSVVAHLRESGFRISVGDVMRALAHLRECGRLHDASWTELVARYARIASHVIPVNSEELLRRALKILQVVRKSVTGRSRENVAAAIVYVCCEQAGYSIPIFRFARLANVPATSLRSNVSLVRSLLLEEAFEEGTRDPLEQGSARDKAEETFPVPVDNPAPFGAEDYRGDGEEILLPVHEHGST
ncbi:MAG: hypothetical protein QXT93_09800 [Thermofilum sp.]